MYFIPIIIIIKRMKDLFNHKKSISILFFLTVLAYCLLVAGCGYRFRGSGEAIGISLDSLAIPLFTSTSSLAGYEADFTRILREEFTRHSSVRIMSEEKAQAVLSGKIRSLITEPLTYSVTKETIHGYTSTDTVTRSREMRVRVEASLIDKQTGTVVWQDDGFTAKAGFSVSSDPLQTSYSQRQAFIAISKDIATRIYSKTMERF